MKALILSIALLAGVIYAQDNKPTPITPVVASVPALTNKDILDMQAAGLSSEVIAEKIKTSVCAFDTSPTALSQLKLAGIPEPLILAMLRWHPVASPGTPSKNDLLKTSDTGNLHHDTGAVTG
jgi:hypothetical protein